MKAVVLEKVTPIEQIKLTEVPMPQVKPGWVLVKVRAFGLNHSEKVLRTLEIEESYIKKPVIPGIECVGEVADPGDTRFAKGQKVCALMDEIFAFLNAHDLQPRAGQVFDLAHIRDAVAAQDSRKVNGKVVVTVYRGASHRRSAPEYGAAHGALRSARYAAGSAPGAGLLPLRGTLPLCHADLQTGNAGGKRTIAAAGCGIPWPPGSIYWEAKKMPDALFQVKNLKKDFRRGKSVIHAVNDVSFNSRSREPLAS